MRQEGKRKTAFIIIINSSPGRESLQYCEVCHKKTEFQVGAF